MKNFKKSRKTIAFIIIIFIAYGIYSYLNKPWQLSVYGDGHTLMRIDYKSKEACLSVGNAYYKESSAQNKRFDCGYKCGHIGDRNDLGSSPVCKIICDNNGCK